MSNGIINNFVGLFTTTNRSIGGIVIDAFVRETHKSDLKITEFPIEIGASINDHAIILPKELEIYGVVSNIPPNFLAVVIPNFGAGTPGTRSNSAYQQLLALQQAREPITIQTGLRSYTNMAIKSLTVERDKDTAGGIYFTCQLKEIIIITNSYTRLPPGQFRRGPTREQAARTDDRGRLQPTIPRGNTPLRNIFGLFRMNQPAGAPLP